MQFDAPLASKIIIICIVQLRRAERGGEILRISFWCKPKVYTLYKLIFLQRKEELLLFPVSTSKKNVFPFQFSHGAFIPVSHLEVKLTLPD